ncbi:pentatricopeptide repeat-containing protein [Tripterygium wilfordii]|uniref:Pentatricopeptide repeat-containing protein n=1 Tax=Tripterygium wilfordii TaxID=458696 RepID=A0A7J7DM34_TRIWF|nr:pentatricopeptide repeat-containing protein [Tripterygium wilfordii]
MITWLAKNDLGEEALDLFSKFKKAGFRPDGQMFIRVFSACGALGDIVEGMLHFESMRKDYGIIPSMEHYVSCEHCGLWTCWQVQAIWKKLWSSLKRCQWSLMLMFGLP